MDATFFVDNEHVHFTEDGDFVVCKDLRPKLDSLIARGYKHAEILLPLTVSLNAKGEPVAHATAEDAMHLWWRDGLVRYKG